MSKQNVNDQMKMVDSDSLAILTPRDNNTLRVSSGFERSEQSFTLQLTLCQHRLTIFSDNLPH